MSARGNFYTFPLCALAMSKPWDQLLADTFGYGVIHYLDHAMPEWRKSKAAALEKAREDIGFTGGSLSVYLEGFGAIEAFASQWARAGRKTFPVRIAKALFFECRDGEGMTEREFRILAAVFSVIGPKGYARAGWEVIQWRAAGYLQRPPGGEAVLLYPRGQIERSLLELRTRCLLTCFSYGKGHAGWRYWASGNMELEKLAHAVVASKNRRAEQQRKEAEISKKASAEAMALTNVSGTCS